MRKKAEASLKPKKSKAEVGAGEAGAEQKIVVRRFRGKDSSRGAVNLGKKNRKGWEGVMGECGCKAEAESHSPQRSIDIA